MSRTGALTQVTIPFRMVVCATSLGVAAVLAWSACSSPSDRPSRQFSEVGPAIEEADEVLRAAIRDAVVPGAVLLVARGNGTRHRRAYGYARLTAFDGTRLADPEKMSVDHVFDLASLTKVFATTLGVMMLIDRDQVNLDDRVSKHLPGFSDAHKDSVLVRHLLTHSAGLFPWKPIYYHASDRQEAFTYIAELPLAYGVGKERHYSDLGFMLLGYVIEEASDRPLDVFLREELYEPLGLKQTAFVPRAHGVTGPFAATSLGNPFERRMVYDDEFGYRVDEDAESFDGWRDYVLVGEVNDGNAHHAHAGVAGHAGLFSTADELRVLMELLLGKGVRDGRRYFSGAVVDTFTTMKEFGNGLGWAMSPEVLHIEDPPPGAFGHTGFTGTYAVAFPTINTCVILLTNRQNFGVGPDGRYNSLNKLRGDIASAILHNTSSTRKR